MDFNSIQPSSAETYFCSIPQTQSSVTGPTGQNTNTVPAYAADSNTNANAGPGSQLGSHQNYHNAVASMLQSFPTSTSRGIDVFQEIVDEDQNDKAQSEGVGYTPNQQNEQKFDALTDQDRQKLENLDSDISANPQNTQQDKQAEQSILQSYNTVVDQRYAQREPYNG